MDARSGDCQSALVRRLPHRIDRTACGARSAGRRGIGTGAGVSEPAVKFVATSLASLHVEPSFLTELLTQITNGVELVILEQREKWCRVRQRDGYEGWAYKPYLVEAPPLEATHMTHLSV